MPLVHQDILLLDLWIRYPMLALSGYPGTTMGQAIRCGGGGMCAHHRLIGCHTIGGGIEARTSTMKILMMVVAPPLR
jgi:hypothetical protein